MSAQPFFATVSRNEEFSANIGNLAQAQNRIRENRNLAREETKGFRGSDGNITRLLLKNTHQRMKNEAKRRLAYVT